jgi:exopolysaccharide biosynthesis polyprenyl glycosylphosphotransferase
MVRLFHVHFPTRTLLLAVAETCLIVLALLTAAFAWSPGEGQLWLSYEHGFLKIGVIAATCMLCMYYYDLYDSVVLRSLREGLTRLIQVLGTVCLLLALLYYAYPAARVGLSTLVVGIILIGASLGLLRNLFTTLNRSPRFAERIVIVGEGPLALSLGEEIERRPELGMRLVGFVGRGRESTVGTNGFRRLGEVEDLPEVIGSQRITGVITAESSDHDRLPDAKLRQLKARGLQIMDGFALYETVTGKVSFDALPPAWMFYSPAIRVSPVLLVYKRATSLLVSGLGLAVTAPLMALIALAIWLDSGRPVIFRQRRVGKGGKLFTLYKFRSMRREADPYGEFKPAQEHDVRFTRVGRWLRRYRLDELPQLYNILRGDMYFVGPRPFAREEEEELAQQIPFYPQRWAIRPGATGWAQVRNGYCASLKDNAEKLSYDLFYIKNMSVGLDLLILFQTTKILLLGRGGR